MRGFSTQILFISLALFVFSNCTKSPVGPADTDPSDGSMADITIPEGFDFDMYTDVDVVFVSTNVSHEIERISAFMSPNGAPIWSNSLVFGLPSDEKFPLRSTLDRVFVTIGYTDGKQHSYVAQVSNNQLIFDLSEVGTSDFSTTSGKTTGGCNETLIHGGGFSTTLDTVIEVNGSYEITMTVLASGCTPVGGKYDQCKELSHYSIEEPSGTTVSNINWTLGSGVSGTPAVGLGNNDGFDGFKLDNVSGIGQNMTTTFSVTYTVSELKTTKFLAKAGQAYMTETFDSTDFACKLASVTPPPTPCTTDTDNDGVTDCNDDFPNDPNLAYIVITDTVSFAVEDNWPWEGDFDFNDLVMPYSLKSYFNASNELVELVFNYKFLARGAANENGLGFSLLTDPSNATVLGYNHTESYVTHTGGIEDGSNSELSVVVQDLVINKLNQYNTIPGYAPVQDSYDSVVVSFATPVDGTVASTFNPFLIISKDRSREIHLSNHTPTFKADTSLIGFGLDAGDFDTEVFYVQDDGKPWVIAVPGEFNYLYEQEEITTGYLNFVAWAQSGGTLYEDWYDVNVPSNVNTTKIFGL